MFLDSLRTLSLGRCAAFGIAIELLLFGGFIACGLFAGPSDSLSVYWVFAISQLPAGSLLDLLKHRGAVLPEAAWLALLVALQALLITLGIWIVARILRWLASLLR